MRDVVVVGRDGEIIMDLWSQKLREKHIVQRPARKARQGAAQGGRFLRRFLRIINVIGHGSAAKNNFRDATFARAPP